MAYKLGAVELTLTADVATFNSNIDAAKAKTKEWGTSTAAAGQQAKAGTEQAAAGARTAAGSYAALSTQVGKLQTALGRLQFAAAGFGLMSFGHLILDALEGYRSGFEFFFGSDPAPGEEGAADAGKRAAEAYAKAALDAMAQEADANRTKQELIDFYNKMQTFPMGPEVSGHIFPQMGPDAEWYAEMEAKGREAAAAFYRGLQFEGTSEDLLGDLLLAKTDQNIARFAEMIRNGMGDALAPEGWGEGATVQGVYDWLTTNYRPGIEAALTDLANNSAVKTAAATLWENLTGSPEGFETLLKGNLLDPLLNAFTEGDLAGAFDLLNEQIGEAGEAHISPEVDAGPITDAGIKTAALGTALGVVDGMSVAPYVDASSIWAAVSAATALRNALLAAQNIGTPSYGPGGERGGSTALRLTNPPRGGPVGAPPALRIIDTPRTVAPPFNGRGGAPLIQQQIYGLQPEDVVRQTRRALRSLAVEVGGIP